MPPTCIAIVNLSTSSPLSASLSPSWLSGLAMALQEQAQYHIAPEWGVGAEVGTRLSDGTDLQPGELVMPLVDGGPPNALGWHDEEGNELFVGYVDISLETDLDDVSQTASHEFCEMLLNAAGNRRADNGFGTWQVPLEACDAVESNRYQASNGYTLSDWLLQSFFDPFGVAPFSFMQSQPNADPAGPWPPGPMLTAPGGYQNIFTPGGSMLTGAHGGLIQGPSGKRAEAGHPLHRFVRLRRTIPAPADGS